MGKTKSSGLPLTGWRTSGGSVCPPSTKINFKEFAANDVGSIRSSLKSHGTLDPSIKIEYRELTDDETGTKFSVTLRGQAKDYYATNPHSPKWGGEYVKMRCFYNGRPIYVNSYDQYLHCGDGEGWSI